MTKILQRAKQFLTWHRRGLAVFAVVACVLVVINMFAPPPPAGKKVLVVDRPVAAGARLTSNDLKTAEVPERYLPDDALTDVEAAIDQVVVTPLRPGTTLTAGALLAGQAPPAGFLHVPVRVSDSHVVQLLRPGSKVSVMGTNTEGRSVTLAASVRVVALPENVSTGMIGGEQGAVVVLEVPTAQAAEVSQAASQRGFSLALG